MRKWLLVAVFAVGAVLLPAQEFAVGSTVPAFSVAGQSIDPHASAVTVLLFTSTRCPVSNAYNARIKQLYDAYKDRGVQFIVLNANSNEPASEVAEHLRSHALSYPVLKDERAALADRFGARITPESYVINRQGTLLYHGAIDDSQNPARVQSHALKEAIDATLAGQPVPRAETKAFGCRIKRR